jgi:hypothetical protein
VEKGNRRRREKIRIGAGIIENILSAQLRFFAARIEVN